MIKRINPNLVRLAELTHNPGLKVDESVLERQAEESELDAPDLKGFVYVPSIGLYVAKERSLTSLNWNQAQKQLREQKLAMPTLYQFREFLKFLRDSRNEEYIRIFNEIVEVREPWRAEWLNARFEERTGLYMISENVLNEGKYTTVEQKLDNFLDFDKAPGISLDTWLNSNANHGLPHKRIPKGNLYYWAPVSGYVARFDVDSGRALLGCSGLPDGSRSSLGVFACAPKARPQKIRS